MEELTEHLEHIFDEWSPAEHLAYQAKTSELIRSLSTRDLKIVSRMMDEKRAMLNEKTMIAGAPESRSIYETRYNHVPHFVVSLEQHEAMIEQGKQFLLEASGMPPAIFDAFTPPFYNFAIEIPEEIQREEFGRRFACEGILVVVSPDNKWLVISKNTVGNNEHQFTFYSQFKADPETRKLELEDRSEDSSLHATRKPDLAIQAAEVHKKILVTMDGRLLCFMSMFILALNHREVTLVDEPIVYLNRQQRRDAERNGAHVSARYRVQISPTIRLRTIINESLRGRNVRRPHAVRGHLRRDRAGAKTIRVKPHQRGGADSLMPHDYNAQRVSVKSVSEQEQLIDKT
jgi:hypothetical protein